jgi:hypothetical protein
MSEKKSDINRFVLIARGRIKDAREEFTRRGWHTLPRRIRGRRILAWIACMAWDGYPSDPEAAVRRICGDLAPYLKEHELAALIESTRAANRRFSNDQCAMIIEISVIDCLDRGYRFLGAMDDEDHVERDKARRARNAACQRRRRAAKSGGRKGGRPSLDLSPEDKLARRRAQGAERARRLRASRKTPSPDKRRITGEVTGFSVTAPDRPSRAPRATRRQEPIIIDMDHDSLDDGVALMAPPPMHPENPNEGDDDMNLKLTRRQSWILEQIKAAKPMYRPALMKLGNAAEYSGLKDPDRCLANDVDKLLELGLIRFCGTMVEAVASLMPPPTSTHHFSSTIH